MSRRVTEDPSHDPRAKVPIISGDGGDTYEEGEGFVVAAEWRHPVAVYRLRGVIGRWRRCEEMSGGDRDLGEIARDAAAMCARKEMSNE
jgi:hypothetical protein